MCNEYKNDEHNFKHCFFKVLSVVILFIIILILCIFLHLIYLIKIVSSQFKSLLFILSKETRLLSVPSSLHLCVDVASLKLLPNLKCLSAPLALQTCRREQSTHDGWSFVCALSTRAGAMRTSCSSCPASRGRSSRGTGRGLGSAQGKG